MAKKLRLASYAFILSLVMALVILPPPSGSVLAEEDDYVYLGGNPIGIVVGAGGLIVIDVGEVVTINGCVTPAGGLGLSRGDVITHCNGEKVDSTFRFREIIEESKGEISLIVRKTDGTVQTLIGIKPALDKLTNIKKLGLLLKEDLAGIGTLTFYTDESEFGALGHHIMDSESGLSKELNSGKIFPVFVSGVVKGENGKAGGLNASINRLEKPWGTINENTDIGIYGEYAGPVQGAKVKVAKKGEVKMGRAQILTTISGTEPRLYDVDIVKTVSQEEPSQKGLVISVRDKELIEKTGGIVQGMSGSPILQNGVLVGAVTHVFLNDTTRGYGVHARFMYDYADRQSEKKEAAILAA